MAFRPFKITRIEISSLDISKKVEIQQKTSVLRKMLCKCDFKAVE